MKIQILILLTFLYSSCSTAVSKPETEFDLMADRLCKVVSDNPSIDYEKYFHKSFRDAVPYATIVDVFKMIKTDFGSCEGILTKSEDGISGSFFTKHKNKVDVRFIMSLKDKKIAGLLYKGKVVDPIVFNSKDEIYEAVSKNPHRVRLLFRKLGGGAYLEHNQKGGGALGSIFKLYILAALVEKINRGELSWDQKFPIKEEFKSLPSGTMQNLKVGTMVTLEEFSSKMISISDNTATDHLLSIVGQNYVEKHMRTNRLNNYWKKTSPFLSTLNMFKTRGFFSKAQAREYESSSREKRVKMLKGIPYKGRENLMSKLGDWTKPRYNEQIEWFASANNICDLLDWSDKQKNSKFRKVIGLNTPFIDLKKSKRWSYAGYKGGSEPGVLEMSYLLEDKKGERWCLYIGQNSETHSFDESKFFAFVEGIIKFLDKN